LIEEIKKRCDAASQGKWSYKDGKFYNNSVEPLQNSDGSFRYSEDKELILNAKNDIKYLLFLVAHSDTTYAQELYKKSKITLKEIMHGNKNII